MNFIDKAYGTELRRTFLIPGLPEQLTAAGRHLQIFDNYIEGTRIRLRLIRFPQENTWIRMLQQRFTAPGDAKHWITAEFLLNAPEYEVFKQFKGREVRKNRYHYDLEETKLELDIYLGQLKGLNMMKANFESETEMREYEPPSFAFLEVTGMSFFTGEILVGKSFSDVQEEYLKIQSGDASGDKKKAKEP